MSAFTPPAPGDRTNAAALPVSERILANLLIAAAIDRVARRCHLPFCPACAQGTEDWLDTFGRLAPQWQAHVMKWCDRYGVPLPGEGN